MTIVNETEYNNYVLNLENPSINTINGIGTCGMTITTHIINNVELAEKVNHEILNINHYKIKL